MTSKRVGSQLVVWKWRVYILGLHNFLWQVLAYCIGSLFPLGESVVSATLVAFVVSCAVEEKSIYENAAC